MAAKYCKTVTVLLWLVVGVFCFVSATLESEKDSESVEVTFYQLSPSQWSSSETAFKSLVATEASTYCAGNTGCGLSSGFSFTSSDVGVQSGPTEDSRSLKVKFYLAFPPGHVLSSSSSTTYVVNAATTTIILANVRSAAEAALGCDITYIGEEYYSISPDATLNKILIPVAFLVLFLIAALAVALHFWNKRKEREEEKKQRVVEREKRKKTSRISPGYSLDSEGKQSTYTWLKQWREKAGRASEKKEKREKRERREGKVTAIQGETHSNGTVPTLSMKTNTMTYDLNPSHDKTTSSEQTTPVNNNQVTARNNALPPLVATATVNEEQMTQEEREKKKEKKKRKKEKHRREEERESRRERSLKRKEFVGNDEAVDSDAVA